MPPLWSRSLRRSLHGSGNVPNPRRCVLPPGLVRQAQRLSAASPALLPRTRLLTLSGGIRAELYLQYGPESLHVKFWLDRCTLTPPAPTRTR